MFQYISGLFLSTGIGRGKMYKNNYIFIIPTYNEAQNISILIKKIFSESKKMNINCSVLVVDDNSPDGTAEIVKNLQKQYISLHLIKGKKQGLGMAYIRGFKYILKKFPNTDYVFEIDADLSHDTIYIEEFIKQTPNFNFIIGSRYLHDKNHNWSHFRQFISKIGNFYARKMCNFHNIHDCTSGYRCISTELLKKINLDEIYTKGFGFQITLLENAMKNKARIKEIPIIFYKRKWGKSKLNFIDFLECFWVLTKNKIINKIKENN